MPAALAGRRERRALSEMFALLEAAQARLGLEGFTLGLTSLEQVFIRFAGAQEEETGAAPGLVKAAAAVGGRGLVLRERAAVALL